jgi:hypothetical protein
MTSKFKAALMVAATSVAVTTVAPMLANAASLRTGTSLLSGITPDAAIEYFKVSSNGEWGVFSSDATNLVADDTNDATDVFVIELSTGDITRVSVYPDGSEGLAGNNSLLPAICGSGRIVAFQTLEDFDLENDYNSAQDIYWVDRDADDDGTYDEYNQDGAVTMSRASIGTNFDEVFDAAQNAAISDNCEWIAYDTSDILEVGDINSEIDVYAHSTVDDTNVLISASLAAGGEGGGGELPVLSSTGKFISFVATGTDIVEATGGKSGVVLINRDADSDDTFDESATGAITREYVSKSTAGVASNGTTDRSTPPAMTSDASCIAFKMTNANDLDDSVVASNAIYLRNRTASTTEVVSVNDGLSATEVSNPAVSSDCRFVSFDSGDADFVLGDTNAKRDVFIRDLALDATTRVSVSSSGTQAIDDSTNAALTLNAGLPEAYILNQSAVAGSTGTFSYPVPLRVAVSELVSNTLAVRKGAGTSVVSNGSFVTDSVLNISHTASGILGTSTLKTEKSIATAKTAAGAFSTEKTASVTPTNGTFAAQTKSGIAIAAGQTLCFRSSVTSGSLLDTTSSTCVARPLSMTSTLIQRSSGSLAWTKVGTTYRTKAKNAKLTMTGVTGRKFVLVATKCNGCGTVQVKLGTKTFNINLQAGSTQNNVLIPINFTGVTNNITGDLTVTVTSTNKFVTVGGIGIARY